METMFDYIAQTPNTPDMSASIEATQNVVGWDLLQKDVNALAKGSTVVMEDINKKAAILKVEEDKIAKALNDIIEHDKGTNESKTLIAKQEETFPNSPETVFANIQQERSNLYKKLQKGEVSGAYGKAYLAGIEAKVDGTIKDITEKREGQGASIVSTMTRDAIGKGQLDSIISSIPTLSENLHVSNAAVNQGVIGGVGQFARQSLEAIDYRTADVDDVSKAVLGIDASITKLETPYFFGNTSPHMQKIIADTKSDIASSAVLLKNKIKDYATTTLNSFRNESDDSVYNKFNGPMPTMRFYNNAYGRDNAQAKYDEDIAKIKQNKVDRMYNDQSPTAVGDTTLDIMASPDAKKQKQLGVVDTIQSNVLGGNYQGALDTMQVNPAEAKMWGNSLTQKILSGNNSSEQLQAMAAFHTMDNKQGGSTLLQDAMTPKEYQKVTSVMRLAQVLPTIGKEGLPNIQGALEKYDMAMKQNVYLEKEDMDSIEKYSRKFGALYPNVKEYISTNLKLGMTFNEAKSYAEGSIKKNFYQDDDTKLEVIAPNGWSTGINKQFLAKSVMNDIKSTRFKGINPEDVFITDMGNGDYKVQTKGGLSLLESTDGQIHYAEKREKFYNSNMNLTPQNISTTPAIMTSVKAMRPEEAHAAYSLFNTTRYTPTSDSNSKTHTTMAMATGITTIGNYLKQTTGIDMTNMLVSTAKVESSLGVDASWGIIKPGKANGLFQITRTTYQDAMDTNSTNQKKLLVAINKHLGKDIRKIPYDEAMKSPLYSTYAAALVYARKEADSGMKFNYSSKENQAYLWKKYYNTYDDKRGTENMFLESAYGTKQQPRIGKPKKSNDFIMFAP